MLIIINTLFFHQTPDALDYHSEFNFLLSAYPALTSQAIIFFTILLIILLLLSFFVSGAEVAYFSLSYKDINMLKTKQQSGYKRIVRLMEEPKILLASLLIANSFVNIAIIIISNFLLDSLLPIHQFWWVEFIIKVLAVSFILVLFGEVMPKVMATQNNIRFANDAGPLIETISYIFKGLSKRLVKTSDFIERKLANKTSNAYSLEELDHAIDITSEDETSQKEKNILKGILKFSNITVKQIMKTRLDVNGINYELNFSEVVKLVEELHYSRLPVFKDDLDTIEGIIHTKDLLPYLEQPYDYNWHPLIRPAYFVHEQKLIEDLLQEFQKKRIHFAIVVDEFGGTSGIVTLEDIMEEIVGDIKDEFDDEDAQHNKLDDYNYVFEGKTMINDVCKIMELPMDTFDEIKGDSETLAGLFLEVAGEIPVINQIISTAAFDFTVLEIEKNRLQKIKVTIRPKDKE